MGLLFKCFSSSYLRKWFCSTSHWVTSGPACVHENNVWRPQRLSCHYLRVASSKGSKTITLSQLNMSWMVAPPNALLYWFLSPDCPIETMVFVTDVPILAPMMIGIATCTSSTVECRNKRIIKRLYIHWKIIHVHPNDISGSLLPVDTNTNCLVVCS